MLVYCGQLVKCQHRNLNYDSLLFVIFPRERGRGDSLCFDAGPEAGVGEHNVETADVRSLMARGENLSGACCGMLHGSGQRRGRSVGCIHFTIHFSFLTCPFQ